MWPIKVVDKGRYRRFMWTGDNIWFHLGHDLDVSENICVYAVDDGEIIFSGQMDGFGGSKPSLPGGCVIIQHPGYICIYGHIKDLPGIKKVIRGDYIGKVAPYLIEGVRYDHLHFGKHIGTGIPIVNHNGKNEMSFLGYETKDNLAGWVNPLEPK